MRFPGFGMSCGYGLLIGSLALGGCTAEPSGGSSRLEGTWTARDTTEYRYRGLDSLNHVFMFANHYPIRVVAMDDSTFSFQVTAGMQTQFDSIVGAGAHRDTVFGVDLDGTIHVRGDTAYVELLGKLPMQAGDDRVIASHRELPAPECLIEVGPFVSPTPPPACTQAHHWSR